MWDLCGSRVGLVRNLLVNEHRFPLGLTDGVKVNLGRGPVLMTQDALDGPDVHVGSIQH